MRRQERYYTSFNVDFVENPGQHYTLPKDYEWIPTKKSRIRKQKWVYPLAKAFAYLYCKFGLHITVVGREKFAEAGSSGFFLYGNHTLGMGDVFLPVHACNSKRVFTVASTANLGIPVVGKWLPCLGALPIPNGIKGMAEFRAAVNERIAQGCCVTLFPEAHLWPYCTFIRPINRTAFRFPVENRVPAFGLTVTFQKKRFGKKPKITAFVDGPIVPNAGLPPKEQAADLQTKVTETMKSRAKANTYTYINYIKLTP
ncbi:MAG TPA: 1-acyl-sn-glycerol-3-phosphate acyltransferase [Petrimonas sp.]|jgi:1-acyl-sn-glycerol-3-phosphate acyltransferase|nr:1-acyl-sn-glycerol-3-phosphate acyltransferase [Petrimonas sp.]